MNVQDLCQIDDNYIEVSQERYNLVGWVLSMAQAAEDFPLEKHRPEAFLDVYKQTQLAERGYPEGYDDDKALLDVKRAFALHLLTLSADDPLVIPDDWVLYDAEAYYMKELWF